MLNVNFIHVWHLVEESWKTTVRSKDNDHRGSEISSSDEAQAISDTHSDSQNEKWSPPSRQRKAHTRKSKSRRNRNSLVRDSPSRRYDSEDSKTSERDSDGEFSRPINTRGYEKDKSESQTDKSENEAVKSESEADKSESEADKSENENNVDKQRNTEFDDGGYNEYKGARGKGHSFKSKYSSRRRHNGKRSPHEYSKASDVLKLDETYNAEEKYVIAKSMRHEAGKDFIGDFERRHGCELKVGYEKETIRPPVIQRKSPPRSAGRECVAPIEFIKSMTKEHLRDGARMVKNFSSVLDICFQKCMSTGYRSISFPVIGTGRMLKFPLDVTVKTMVDAAIRASTDLTTCIKTITIVAYEEKAYLALVSELPKTASPSMPLTTEETDTKKDEGKHKRRDRIISCSITISASEDELSSVRRRLEQEVRDKLLHTETVHNPKQLGLPMRLKGRIYQHVNKGGIAVCVSVDQRTGNVILKGEKRYVHTCKSELSSMFASGDFKLDKPLKCDFQFWTALAYEQTQVPSYWTNFPPCQTLSEVLKTTASNGRCVVVPVDKSTEKAVKQMVKDTWTAELVGHGRDAINLNHTSIEVKKIERIENLDLFSKYALKRQEFFRSLSDDDLTSFPTLKELPVENKGNVMTQDTLKRPLGNELFPEVNECFVFHGTKPEIIQTIIHQGLDYRMSSEKAMFGMGIYGAESSTKADQYADSKQSRTPGDKQMLILRMILGKSYICSDPNPRKFRRPPCTHPSCRRDDCTETHQRFDSVVGDGQWLFREFVVYAADQCYPEFLVTYERK
ncbi:hypothetical protein FSP39_010419 [Pinctada imbricata]|uniref:Poly [ADP-ribose] polymerase n=1 Tax=Pinctada imbricata TaxID=66713 RepID=A0AA89BZ72_PINIB|nr:hypothetical protein FSP39_010419 [Pinctada imbricata]